MYRVNHFFDFIIVSLCLAAIYWLIGFLIKALLGKEIRSEKGFFLIACIGGALLKLILPKIL
jgi:hypothetical protein|tara:strand:- start:1021 stop:1206 length:186 start_codon:yes stop_codon:yes gene_type:complete